MRHIERFIISSFLLALSACDSATTEPPVDSIAIRQVAETLEVGQVDTLAASLHAGASAVASGAQVRWTSSEPQVYAIDSVTGVGKAVKVVAPTSVTVTAAYQALQARTTVLVIPGVIRLKLVMSSALALGHTVRPVAGILGDPSFGLYTEASAAWGTRFESANPGVVRVNADGTLTAVSIGSTRIAVTIHGKRDSADVSVIGGYSLTYLSGTAGLRVIDVNDSATVLAAQLTSNQPTLLRSGQQQDLAGCQAKLLNNVGQVLCLEGLYDKGRITDLFLSGTPVGTPSGLNERGEVFGLLKSPDSLRNRAFILRAGTMEVLPALANGVSLTTTGQINLTGYGLAQISSLYTAPLILRAEGHIYLNSPAGRYANALDINDAGNVVGSSENMRRSGNAAIWRKSLGWNGEMLGPRTFAATAISERDEAVGLGDDGAFVWKDGKYTVLADVIAEQGWTFGGAPAVSRNGTIAVFGTHVDGRKGVVLVKLP